jgi:hypothetical protein
MFKWSLKHYCKNINLTFEELERIPLNNQDLSSICLNEFITDKYGRNGHLVNIGEYYLFQPIELRDKNASIFDRSVPIDYKHDMINFEIKKNMVKPIVDKKNLNKALIEEEGIRFPEGKRLLDEMQVNFDISRDYSKQPKVPRGDDNWYKHCGIVMKKMARIG